MLAPPQPQRRMLQGAASRSRTATSACRVPAARGAGGRAARRGLAAAVSPLLKAAAGAAPPPRPARPASASRACGANSAAPGAHEPRRNPEQQLEQAWSQHAAEAAQLADNFFAPLKARASDVPGGDGARVFVFVRHGHSTWNQQSRIQGNTDESELTALGRVQAVRAREALFDIPFDSCLSSPHTRARQTAEVVWQPWQELPGTAEPLYLPSLAEVDLGWFQGLRNDDIARSHPELYRVWREEPERFQLDGRFPVLDAFRQARRAWHDMLAQPGSRHLVITHKSLLRALLATALGLPPRQFRALDIANGAICMARVNARGDIMLSALNLTSHLSYSDVRYTLPGSSHNEQLARDACRTPAAAAAARAAARCSQPP